MTTILRTENLKREFTQGSLTITALDDINISLKEGSLVMLAGRSGSGKTTLINLMGALDRPSEGKIYFEDKEITNLNDKSRDYLRRNNMGFIFQSVALISVLNAYENVEFGLRLAQTNSLSWDERVKESLKHVGLEKRINHKPHQLSGGEQQRVAIARAIVSKPRIIFADEPTAELDLKTGLKIVNLFRYLVDNENLTIIMTTHDPNMLELADQVIQLEDGRLVK